MVKKNCETTTSQTDFALQILKFKPFRSKTQYTTHLWQI